MLIFLLLVREQHALAISNTEIQGYYIIVKANQKGSPVSSIIKNHLIKIKVPSLSRTRAIKSTAKPIRTWFPFLRRKKSRGVRVYLW